MWQKIKDFFDIGVTPTPSFEGIRYLYIRSLKLFDHGAINKCPKCAYEHMDHINTTKYIKELNVIRRDCFRCGWSWYERCADGSEPNPEVDWNIVSGKETSDDHS